MAGSLGYWLGYPDGQQLPYPVVPGTQASKILGQLDELETSLHQIILDSIAIKAGKMELDPAQAVRLHVTRGRALCQLLSTLTDIAIKEDMWADAKAAGRQWRVPG
jgi:hypothetical protein